jgi:mannose-6-phosphate isomerase-like protein (cupin superfamily)
VAARVTTEERHAMPTFISTPVTVPAAGDPPKTIIEYVGRASTGSTDVSIARMSSPAGWSEPAQVPEFDEYTVVLAGSVLVEHDEGTTEVSAGQAIAVAAGERVRYSTPGGAEYLAVCLPAFSPDTVHRED